MKSWYFLPVAWALMFTAGCAQRDGLSQSQGPAVADFHRRINAYVILRDELERGAAKLDETIEPTEIVTAQLVLANRIRQARPAARRGDIFTPVIQERFRRLLTRQMRGVRGQNTRGIIFDEGPGPDAFSFSVNSQYPKAQPLGTVPPNILEALPPLPEHIEYRFIGRHLILRDARANLIIDYMPNAIS